MKNRLLVALILFYGLSAQAGNWGIRGGVNLANVSGDGYSGTTSTSGLVLGLFNDMSLAGIFGLEIGLNYIGKGYEVLGITTKMNYLEVPAYFKLKLPIPILKPYLGAGPSVGMLLSANTAGLDTKSSFNTLDFGINMGGGLEISLGVVALLLDARYQIGLADITQVATSDKNVGLQLTGALVFGL